MKKKLITLLLFVISITMFIACDESLAVNKSIPAQDQDIAIFTINFDCGIYSDTIINPIKVNKYDKNDKLLEKFVLSPEIQIKDMYKKYNLTKAGWYTDSSFNENSLIQIWDDIPNEKNITLYLKWDNIKYPQTRSELLTEVNSHFKNDNTDLKDINVSNIKDMCYLFTSKSCFKDSLLKEVLDLEKIADDKITDIQRDRLKKLKDISEEPHLEVIPNFDLSNWNTSNVTDMSYMFCNEAFNPTSGLGENFDTSNVTNMAYMFCCCRFFDPASLGEKFDTSNVTDMVYMFYGCSKFNPELGLGEKFDTSNVTNISHMFENCQAFNPKLGLGNNFNTSNVTNMISVFYDCKSFNPESGLGENFNTSNVTNMACMFSGCSTFNPTSGIGNYFDTSKVTSMAYMFNGCKAFNPESGLGEKFDTNNITNMNYMFDGCALNPLPSWYKVEM